MIKRGSSKVCSFSLSLSLFLSLFPSFFFFFFSFIRFVFPRYFRSWNFFYRGGARFETFEGLYVCLDERDRIGTNIVVKLDEIKAPFNWRITVGIE